MNFAEYIYNIEPLKILLGSGRDVNVTNYRGESILVEAIKFNRVQHVKLLMDYKADVNVVDDNGDTPLLMACRTGHTECLELLFSDPVGRPDVNYKDGAGETGAMLAAKNGHLGCLKMLFRNEGVNLSLTNHKGENALMLAVEWNHLICTKVLLENKINPNARNIKMGGQSALHRASSLALDDIVHILINHGANVNAIQYSGLTSLMCAAKMNSKNCVQYLLAAGADVNMGDIEGVTAAMIACSKGSSETLMLLLQAGVNVNATDIYGGNCLKHALKAKSWKSVDLILAYGAFVKSIFNVYNLCGDDPEACSKLTEILYAAGGHSYVGEKSDVAEEKRRADREELENSAEVTGLIELCKNIVYDRLAKNYPGTNRFPLIQSLPGPVGQKRLLLNGVSLDIEVPLESALRCTAYESKCMVCAMCLCSETELCAENLELTSCSQCRLLAYCSERCDQNHWAMAHIAACTKDLRSKSYGPVCVWCLRPCTLPQDGDFVTCETCERVSYCSPICRTADWVSVHKNNCFKRRPTMQYVNLR